MFHGTTMIYEFNPETPEKLNHIEIIQIAKALKIIVRLL